MSTNYTAAYYRAYRLTKLACYMLNIRRDSITAQKIYDRVWNRTANEA